MLAGTALMLACAAVVQPDSEEFNAFCYGTNFVVVRRHWPSTPKKRAMGTWMPPTDLCDILNFVLDNALVRMPDGRILRCLVVTGFVGPVELCRAL